MDYSEEGMQRILSWAREKGLPVDGSEEERMDAVREAAEHELRLVLRRVKREMAKAGVARATWQSPPTWMETPGRRCGYIITW